MSGMLFRLISKERWTASSTSRVLSPLRPPWCWRSAMMPESPHGALSQLIGSRKIVKSQVSEAAQSSLIPSTPQSSGLTNATWGGNGGGFGAPGYWWWSRITTGNGCCTMRSSQLDPVSTMRTGPWVAERSSPMRVDSTPKSAVAWLGYANRSNARNAEEALAMPSPS